LDQVGYKKIIYSESENTFAEILRWFFLRSRFILILANAGVFWK
jgi:hypothetical protein